MKISYNWLKTLIDTDKTPEEIAVLLTDAGLEVEGFEAFESVKGGLKGVVVGEVLSCEKHPDADRLKLTKVNIGGVEPLSIVCGAPNVAAGQKVLVATVGAVLYPTEGGSLEMKKSKIRGAVSEGMICAEDELGLGHSHDGILVLPENTEVGTPAAAYFNVEKDVVFEIGLTPNRSDAASHFGVARDLAAILNFKNNTLDHRAQLKYPAELPEPGGLNTVDIEIRNKEACKRYTGLVLSGVEVKESPDWLKNRLLAIGLRPINNVVDITNFVLHETGQPLHAFDYEKIKGRKVIVDVAKEGTVFKTLDGIERKLNADDLMIQHELAPMCIAGVFGGEESGVTESTKMVFLESACFNPDFIRRTAKRHALKTDASFRFERGTDPEMTVTALMRAAGLMLDIAGGSVSMGVTDVYPEKLEPFKIAFSYQYCNDLIGKAIDKQAVKTILVSLGIQIETEGNDGLLLQVPRYKTDVTRAADVVEEVMRIYGYNQVEPSKRISYTAYNVDKNFDLMLEEKFAAVLSSNGFNETMNLSLSKSGYYQDESKLVRVVNPLSNDLNVMRAEMLYGGLETIQYNVNRKQNALRLYEIGKTYETIADSAFQYKEHKHLSLWITGKSLPENHLGLNHDSDFYVLKGVVDMLLDTIGVSGFQVSETEKTELEFGLKYVLNNHTLAELGSVSKKTLSAFDIKQKVFYADFNWQAILKIFRKHKVQFKELPLFPSVRRDLALLLDRTVKYESLKEAAFNSERKLLKEVNLFDVYEGEKLGNKKSYALSFTLQSNEATLTDKQIDKVMEKLISLYKDQFGAELR